MVLRPKLGIVVVVVVPLVVVVVAQSRRRRSVRVMIAHKDGYRYLDIGGCRSGMKGSGCRKIVHLRTMVAFNKHGRQLQRPEQCHTAYDSWPRACYPYRACMGLGAWIRVHEGHLYPAWHHGRH